jgi:hypothetical protein
MARARLSQIRHLYEGTGVKSYGLPVWLRRLKCLAHLTGADDRVASYLMESFLARNVLQAANRSY